MAARGPTIKENRERKRGKKGGGNYFVAEEKKNSHILPIGQWYAPSAVNNDAWYCMVLHCIA